MSSAISLRLRLDEDQFISEEYITGKIGDLKSSVSIGEGVLEIRGAIKPMAEVQIGKEKLRVSPVQNILLELVNRCGWKSLTFFYGRPILMANPIADLLGEGMVDFSDDRQAIKVKEGSRFLDTVVQLTSIFQNEYERKRKTSDELDQETSKKTKYSEDIKFRLLCPVTRVSFLIGTKGETIKQMGHKTKAFIRVITDVDKALVPYCTKRVVEIAGSAKKQLPLRDPPSFGSCVQMGVVLVADTIMESKSKASILVDRHCIKQKDLTLLESSTGAKFEFKKKAPAVANKNERVVKISGTRAKVHQGLVSITTLIELQQETQVKEE